MATDERTDKKGNPFLLILILVLVFLNLPGMLMVGYLKHTSLTNLSLQQLWTSSVFVSVGVLIVLRIGFKEWMKALGAYLIICFVYAMLSLAANNIFNQEIPKVYLTYFFDEKQTNNRPLLEEKPQKEAQQTEGKRPAPPASSSTVTLTLPGGDSYVGEVKKGNPHGFGTLYRANGGRYEGYFEKGKRIPGKGKLYLPDGQVTEM